MDLPVSPTVTGLKNPDRSTSQGNTKLSLVDRMGCRILFYKKAVMPKKQSYCLTHSKQSNKKRKRRKKSFYFSFILFLFHSFYIFLSKHCTSSLNMASTSHCVGMWQPVRSGCTAGGRELDMLQHLSQFHSVFVQCPLKKSCMVSRIGQND